MTHRRFVSTLLILTLTLFGSTPVSLTANTAVAGGALSGIGQITYVEGRVDRGVGADYFPLVRQESISAGDTIRTKSFSRAEIVFSDKSVLRIGENSQVQVRDFTQGKESKGSLFVDRGKVRVILPAKNSTSHFQYETPNSKGELKGSDLGVSYLKSATSIMAIDGEASASNVNFPDKQIRVIGGNTAYVPYDAPPATPRPYLKIEKKKFEAETSPAPVTPDLGQIRKAIIAKFTGEVRVRSKSAPTWHAPAVKEALGAGDEIETGEGKVLLVLESGREVYLREKTHLKIKSLTRDPKTGTLEDVLESKLGAIRAKIEKKKKGNSKFQISSPIAVAAVKGTVLYFFITKNASTSFFEQGSGSLTNLIKKAAIDINAGQYGSVGADGETYGPAETSPEKLDEIERGWDIPENTYGYSAPPGVVEIPYEVAEEPLDETEDETIKPFEEIKPDITGSETPSTLDEEAELQAFGTWGAGGLRSLYSLDNNGFRWEGEDTGLIMAAVFPWTSPQAFVLALTVFSAESEGFKPLLFNSTIGSRIVDEVLNPENTEATSDGGAFFGFTAGLWSGVEGTLVALFVDPDKNVGVLTGNVNGAPDFPTNSFEASGFLQPAALGTFPGINPEFFSEYIRFGYAEGSLAGGFDSESYLEGSLGRAETLFLYDETRENFPSFDFGIYNFQFSGNFYQSESEIWNARAGGWAQFGFYVPFESECLKDDEGYWLAELGGSWSGGEIRGNLIGAFLTKTHLGVLGGEVTGLYDFLEGSYGNYILQSIGVFQSSPLSFFGKTSGSLVDAGGNIDGDFTAYVGGVNSILADGGQSDVFILGNMSSNYYASPFQIWRDDVKSYNALEKNKTTYDGGAFYAYTAGSRNFSMLTGGFAGIYVGPSGEGGASAGLITGNLQGEFFDDLEMYSMNGTLSSRMKEMVEIDAEDMNRNHVGVTNGRGLLVGSFEGEEGPAGFISGVDTFQTASLVDGDNGYAADWGIYQQSFGDTGFSMPAGSSGEWSGFMGGNDPFGFYVAEEGEYGYELEEDNGFWIADITDGTFEDNGLNAHLSGRFLTGTKTGTLEGDIFGVYAESESNYWNAYGVGIWEGQDLDFAGQLIGSDNQDFATLFGNEEFDFSVFGSLENSLLGGLGNLGGESHILLMGNFDFEDGQTPVLWGIEIRSSSVYDEAPVTFGGDAFWGFAGGRFSDGEVRGGARMIYILNDGGYESGYTAGIAAGDLDGNYRNFSKTEGMWLSEGDFTAKAMATVEFDPEDLNGGEYNIIQEREFEAAGFSGQVSSEENNLALALFGSGEFANIEGQDWGILAGLFGGFYAYDGEFERGSDFRLAFGGVTNEEYEGEGEYPIYFFGTMDGSLQGDETGTLEADASGVWISEQGQQEQFVKVGLIEAQTSGNFSSEGGIFGEGQNGGLVQATTVGSWSAVTQLDADMINFQQIQEVLSGVGLTEIGNSLALGQGSFNEGQGAITGTMEASFFNNFQSLNDGIWSAFFNGNFSGLPSEVSSWAANFEGSDVSAQLSGVNWQDGQWLANVNGTFGPDQTNFTGQAGGTYVSSELDPNSGTFSGVGVGTFEAGCQECT